MTTDPAVSQVVLDFSSNLVEEALWDLHNERQGKGLDITHEVKAWIRRSLKAPVRVQKGRSYVRLMFETVEDAAIFKLFWL